MGETDAIRPPDHPTTRITEDVEMLQDLVLTAVRDALKASQDLAADKMGAVTAGLRIPGIG
jgi:nucleoid-associated protein EbfC